MSTSRSMAPRLLRARLAEPITGLSLSAGRLSPRGALWLGSLICLLVAEGAASTRSYVWAAPVLAMLVVAVAVYIPLTAFLGATLLVRILTDASLSSPTIRHTGSLNLSGGIALLFILVAAGLLIQRRRGVGLAVAMTLWLCLWTAVAVASHGASTETVREGVRELSIVAVAVIVLNSSNKLSLAPVVRLIQVVGLISALVAVYQLATHTGILINREVRANGTFTHPNGAAMFFAIATIASVWRYWDSGRRRLDLLLAAIFATATVATFSLSGLAALLAMLMAFGSARPGSVRVKFGAYVVAALVVAGFLATPLGGERLANESSTSLQSAQVRGAANTSFAWRLYKWGTLIPQWEQSPYIGQGLGTTVTAEGNSENVTAGRVPHNEYLRYLVETGVIGLAILLGGLVMLIRRLAARRRVPGAPDSGALGIAVVAGCLVNALADNTLLYTTTGYAAALILAAVLVSTASGVRTTGAQVA